MCVQRMICFLCNNHTIGLYQLSKSNSNATLQKLYFLLQFHNEKGSRRRIFINSKASFRQNVFRLITNNNVSRRQIKDNMLDSKSGFNWDKEVTQLALRLRYEGKNPKPIEELPLYLYHSAIILQKFGIYLRSFQTTSSLSSKLSVVENDCCVRYYTLHFESRGVYLRNLHQILLNLLLTQ